MQYTHQQLHSVSYYYYFNSTYLPQTYLQRTAVHKGFTSTAIFIEGLILSIFYLLRLDKFPDSTQQMHPYSLFI